MRRVEIKGDRSRRVPNSLRHTHRPDLQRDDTSFVISEGNFTFAFPSTRRKLVTVIVFSVTFIETTGDNGPLA